MEKAKLHPGAEPLIMHAALLAPEPIPLFLFAEAHENLGEPLTSALEGDGLDETVAALRTFALIDRDQPRRPPGRLPRSSIEAGNDACGCRRRHRRAAYRPRAVINPATGRPPPSGV